MQFSPDREPRYSTNRAVLAAIFLSSMAIHSTTHAATWVVDTVLDQVDTLPGDGVCVISRGGCSLRAAVMEANAQPGADRIELNAGTYSFVREGSDEDSSVTGDLDIWESLTLVGVDKESVVIDLLGVSERGFELHDGKLQIEQLTLRNGVEGREGLIVKASPKLGQGLLASILVKDVIIEEMSKGSTAFELENIAASFSKVTARENDAILINANDSRVSVDDSEFNNATIHAIKSFGGGVLAISDSDFTNHVTEKVDGGAIRVRDANVIIRDSYFAENYAGGKFLALAYDGGAASFYSAHVTLYDTQFDSNGSGGNGGAIDSYASHWVSRGLTFTDNKATKNGGAINATQVYNGEGLTMAESRFVGNKASLGGGAIYSDSGLVLNEVILRDNAAEKTGGAIHSKAGKGSLNRLEVTGNSAPNGGGLYLLHPSLAISDSLIANNTGRNTGGGISIASANGSGNLALSNLTVAGNTSAEGSAMWVTGVDKQQVFLANSLLDGDCVVGVAKNNGGNLSVSASCEALASVVTDLALTITAGADNTMTQYVPSDASPAVAAGSPNKCSAIDQIGQLRAVNCTSGAFETGAEAATPGVIQAVFPANVSDDASSFDVILRRSGGTDGPIKAELYRPELDSAAWPERGLPGAFEGVFTSWEPTWEKLSHTTYNADGYAQVSWETGDSADKVIRFSKLNTNTPLTARFMLRSSVGAELENSDLFEIKVSDANATIDNTVTTSFNESRIVLNEGAGITDVLISATLKTGADLSNYRTLAHYIPQRSTAGLDQLPAVISGNVMKNWYSNGAATLDYQAPHGVMQFNVDDNDAQDGTKIYRFDLNYPAENRNGRLIPGSKTSLLVAVLDDESEAESQFVDGTWLGVEPTDDSNSSGNDQGSGSDDQNNSNDNTSGDDSTDNNTDGTGSSNGGGTQDDDSTGQNLDDGAENESSGSGGGGSLTWMLLLLAGASLRQKRVF